VRAQILYIGSTLPALSETFVYREVLALRDKRVPIVTASVRRQEEGLGDPRADALRAETIIVYGPGVLRLLKDAGSELVRRPLQTLQTVAMALGDSLCRAGMRLSARPKCMYQMLAGLALARRVRSRNVRHIHAHMAHVPTTIAMYAARQLGISFSFTGHANDLFPQRTLLPQKLRRAKFIACISKWHREFYRGFVDLPDERLPIVRCGVDIPPEPAQPKHSGGPPLIVSVGRLIPKKGFDTLVRAVAALNAAGCRLECRIVGGGPEQDQLKTLVEKLGVARVVSLLGPQPNTEARRLIADADLFVLPCRVDADGDRDGIPVVLMEAMAAETCVVAGDLPPIRELVWDGQTGVVVPPDDAAALATIIATLLADPDRRKSLARAGREWVRTEFSRETNIDRLAAVFRAVVPKAVPESQPERRRPPPIAGDREAAKRPTPDQVSDDPVVRA